MKVVCNKAMKVSGECCKTCFHASEHDIIYMVNSQKCTQWMECFTGKNYIKCRCVTVKEKKP